jgi:hypothetical protein
LVVLIDTPDGLTPRVGGVPADQRL